jgi:hypothetical protein
MFVLSAVMNFIKCFGGIEKRTVDSAVFTNIAINDFAQYHGAHGRRVLRIETKLELIRLK